jgi:hypothetical protein
MAANAETTSKKTLPFEMNMDFSVKILMNAEFGVKDMDLLVRLFVSSFISYNSCVLLVIDRKQSIRVCLAGHV